MSGTSDSAVASGGGEFMLFGVRVVVDSMRKSVSMNNLSQYEQPPENSNNIDNNINCNKDDVAAAGGGGGASGYASADDAVQNSRGSRERKRGVPWTEEEHKLFLLGLQKVGKGDWRGISRNFVKTRTPTQVASHAQKYFLRRTNLNRRRRRSSLFDITTDSVTAIPMEEEHQDNKSSESHPLPPPSPESNNRYPVMHSFPVVLPSPIENPIENLTLGQAVMQSNNMAAATTPTNLIRPIPVHHHLQSSSPPEEASKRYEINFNSNLTMMMDPSPLSLKLSLQSDRRESSSRHSSAFQVMSSFNNGDNSSNNNSIISVA